MPPFTLQHVPNRTWTIHAVGGGLLAALGAAFYFGYLAPSSRNMATRHERIVHLQALLASKEQIVEEHAQLEGRLNRLNAAVINTRKRMPLRSPAQDFIERANQLATRHAVKLEMCTASAPQTYPTHGQVEVSCRLSGSYASICRYLAAIDQLSQISKVSQLEVRSHDNSDSYPAEAVFQLYYRPELHDTEMKQGTL